MDDYSLTPYGPLAWLVSSDDHDHLKALSQACDTQPPPHLSEWVIAYETLLLIFQKSVPESTIRTYLEQQHTPLQIEKRKNTLHEIPIRYDGPDLQEIAQATRLNVTEIINRHSAPTYTVRFLGFSPGFAYLDGLDPQLIIPRRAHPRPRMEMGALAIGGPHTGIYTVPSPGGWHWLGHTDNLLFQPDSELIALYPGDTVRFLPQDA